MAAFQFPDPAVETTVVNPITGSTYQWKEPPGKWVVTTKIRSVDNIIWEGDDEPDPNPGDYKLWYHTEELELYYWYEDVNGVGAWLPTSAPITMLEDLDASLAEVKADVVAANVAINENENRLDSIIYFGPTAPPILPDDVYTDPDGNVTTEQNKINYKFWIDTDTNQLYTLRLQDPVARTYAYEEVAAGSEIWFGDDPPTDEHYDLWFDTTRLELLVKFNGQWWPVSIPADQLEDLRKTLETELQGVFDEISKVENEAFQGIRDVRYGLDLDQVLQNGAIANQGAEFKGKVSAEPGTKDNELVTYGQLATVAEELEQLAPSIEHGSWTWTTNENPGPGQYTTIKEANNDKLAECASTWQECLVDAGTDNIAKAQCQREYDACLVPYKPGPSPDFSKTHQIKFNNQDSQGNDITFDTVKVGQLIDVFNDSNDDYLVGEITIKSDATFTITRKSSKGFASGLGRIKIFTLNDQVEDLTNYVRKTGDTMSGQLEIKGNARSEPLFLLEPTDSRDTDSIFRINDKEGDDILEILGNGQAFYERTPTAGAELTNKSYVDDKLSGPAPSNFSWSFRKISGSPIPGEMVCTSANPGKGTVITFSHTDFNGNKFHKRTDTILFNSALATPLITIWDKTDEGYRHKLTMCVRSISQDSDGNLRVEMGESAGATNHNLSENNVEHWVTIGGFF